MSVDYTPSFVNYTGQGKFRFWCQSVLPLVYDDSLSYMELLNKMVIYLNKTIQDVAAVETNVDSLLAAYNQLQKYVNDYFDNLDVQDEINVKLNGLVEDGTMSELIQPFIDAGLPGLVETNLPGVVENQIPGVVAEQLDDVVEEQIGAVVAEQIPNQVTNWLGENVTPVGSAVIVDATLTIEGAAADAKAVGDSLDELKDSITSVEGYFVPGINMFNPNDPDIVYNVWLLRNGNLEENHSGYFASGFYPVIPGQTLCLNYPTGIFGSASSIVWYDENKSRIGYTINVEQLTDNRGIPYIRYTVPQDAVAKYFRVTGSMTYITFYMYVYAAEMPTTYKAYTTGLELSEEIKVPFENIINISIDKDDTNFIVKNSKNPVNLENVETGVIVNSSTSATVDSSATTWRTTDYIAVKPNTVYSMFVAPGVYYGSGFRGIPFFDSNLTYLGRIIPDGGVSTTIVLTTITTPNRPDVAYIRTSYPASYVNTPKLRYLTMIIEGSTWPGDMYIHYDGEYRVEGAGLSEEFSEPLNSLFGKTALWNGDSICAADGDPIGGWPERIAEANGMRCKNYGISGGTITENTTASHSVSATLDGMMADFPNADYVIIEGGTNDADILGDSGIGTFDENDFSAEYIAALDKNTFSGALESIFYRLVTIMKGKHIGYLIPQKMGHTEILVARRRTYFDRATQIAQKWGVPVLDLWNNLYFNWRLSAHWNQDMTSAENNAANNLYRDGQHLTDFGYQIQSPIIAQWMKGI